MPDSPAKLSSLFIGLDPPAPSKSPTPRSPRNFVDGAVGLGIVAAMIVGGTPARSGPIPILSARPAASWEKPISGEDEDEEMELSESYTCVISHVGGKPVSKRVYFDGGCSGDSLSRCYLCRKDLHGLDIFMYRGEKSFCSVECRSQQILSDEHMEKCGSDAMMKTHFDCSLSPCSTPFYLAAGVAAA